MSALLEQLADDVELVEGQPRIDDHALSAWTQRLAAWDGDRDASASELIAYALKFFEAAPEASAYFIAQVGELVGALIGQARVASAFEQAGLASSITGIEESKIPVGAREKPAGSRSPFDLLLKKD